MLYNYQCYIENYYYNNNNNNNNCDRYLEVDWELKNLWTMKVIVIPVVTGALGTILKGLVKGLKDLEIRGQVKTIQTIALLRSARILWKILET